MIHAISTFVNGCELDQVSIQDMDAYEDTEINWRVRRGYGALMTAYGAPCPVALNTEVTLVDHSGTRVRIETSRGTLSADKVIVTVPTNVIADEAIRFHPALPAKVEAARGLPLGVDDKVMLALEDADALPKDGNLRGATMRTAMGSFRSCARSASPASKDFSAARLRANWRIGRRRLRRRQHRPDRRAARLGLSEEAEALERITLGARRLRRGSYSYALPGHAGDRAKLAAPVDGRLFFAGEATSPNFFSTAHGARDLVARRATDKKVMSDEMTGYCNSQNM